MFGDYEKNNASNTNIARLDLMRRSTSAYNQARPRKGGVMKQACWQPIDTAPRDGTSVILAWAIDADGDRIRWEHMPKTAHCFVQVAAWSGDEWIVYCSQVCDPKLHFTPTHWMPIPPSPAVFAEYMI